jgi:rubrerythrin
MLAKDLARTLEALQVMAEAEDAVGEFYLTCANFPGEDRSFWMQLAGEEASHRVNIQKMAETISQNPEKFSLHRPFNAAAVRTFVSFLRRSTADLRENKVPREKLLFLARDIERSLLELSYFEIVKSPDPTHDKALREILVQTAAHNSRLEQKISQISAKGQ